MPSKELLPLLPVFDAVFSELNLSRAAERLGVSQSAVSQALARLRHLTSDELFESTGRGVRPSPRAQLMIRHVRAALAEADAVLKPAHDDLLGLSRQFGVHIPAGFDACLLPALHGDLGEKPPGIHVRAVTITNRDAVCALNAGDVDLSLGFGAIGSKVLKSQLLPPLSMVSIMRKDHPMALRNKFSDDEFHSLNQVGLDTGEGNQEQAGTRERARLQIAGHTVVSASTLYGLGAVVSSTGLAATVPAMAAVELCKRFDLAVRPSPMPPCRLHMLWHERLDSDPGHRWLRDTIVSAFNHLERAAHGWLNSPEALWTVVSRVASVPAPIEAISA